MKRSVLVVLAVVGSACAGVQLPKEQLTEPGALLFNGYVKTDADCWHCHNGDGKGARGPSLAVRVPKLSAEAIKKTIREGDGFMPKYDTLSDDEVNLLTTWLQATFPAK